MESRYPSNRDENSDSRWQEDVERRLRALETGRRAEATAIGSLAAGQLTLYDAMGNIIVGDDVAGGLSRPYIPMMLEGAPASTGAADFESTHWVTFPKQQPRARIWVWGQCPLGSTGEIQIVMYGSDVGPAQVMADDTGQTYEWDVEISGAHMSLAILEVQMRITSGAGVVTATISMCHGLGT